MSRSSADWSQKFASYVNMANIDIEKAKSYRSVSWVLGSSNNAHLEPPYYDTSSSIAVKLELNNLQLSYKLIYS